MKTLLYRVQYTKDIFEYVWVTARDSNSGFTKALKQAQKPYGNGKHPTIKSITFEREG